MEHQKQTFETREELEAWVDDFFAAADIAIHALMEKIRQSVENES